MSSCADSSDAPFSHLSDQHIQLFYTANDNMYPKAPVLPCHFNCALPDVCYRSAPTVSSLPQTQLPFPPTTSSISHTIHFHHQTPSSFRSVTEARSRAYTNARGFGQMWTDEEKTELFQWFCSGERLQSSMETTSLSQLLREVCIVVLFIV